MSAHEFKVAIQSPVLPQTLVDPERKLYEVSSQMSIEFEVDGPYKASLFDQTSYGGFRVEVEVDGPYKLGGREGFIYSTRTQLDC